MQDDNIKTFILQIVLIYFVKVNIILLAFVTQMKITNQMNNNCCESQLSPLVCYFHLCHMVEWIILTLTKYNNTICKIHNKRVR